MFRIPFRGPEGPLFHQGPETHPHPDTRRCAGCLFFLFVQRRRDTEARKGVRAAGLHEQIFTTEFLTYRAFADKHEIFFQSPMSSGAGPSGPARKLKKALARGRTCRDDVCVGG
jgi:hypothetical protein